MKIELIPNKGPASMGPEIIANLGWATEVNIASGFVTVPALNYLDATLIKSIKEKRALKIRLIFGLYQRFTPPQALAKMIYLQDKYPGQFFARVAQNARFHWKYYQFKKLSSSKAYVGSANFTNDGLTTEGDLSVKISGQNNDPIIKSLANEFNNLWNEEKSFALNNELLKKYKKIGRPPSFHTDSKEDEQLSSLLKAPVKIKLPKPQLARPRSVFLDEDLSQETEKIIRTQTDWEKKGWDYLCHPYKNNWELTRSARVILIVTDLDDSNEFTIEWHHVKDSTDAVMTPDGKYFIAHTKVPGGRRYPLAKVKKDLALVGLPLKKVKSDRYLSDLQIDTICRLLHVKRDKLMAV